MKRATFLFITSIVTLPVLFAASVHSGQQDPRLDGWHFLGLEGEEVWSLAIDPENPSYIYAGTYTGIHRTTDAGGTWSNVYPSGLIWDIAIHPESTAVVYATQSIWTAPALVKSTDRGETWFNADGDLQYYPEEDPIRIAIDPSDPSTIYLGTAMFGSGRLLKTTNGGINWFNIEDSVFIDSPWQIVIDETTPSTVYVTGIAGVYKSTNAGESWVFLGPDVYGGGAGFAFGIDPIERLTLYHGVIQRYGFFKSTDGGSSWVQSNDGLLNLELLAIAVSGDTESQILLGTNGGAFRSTDQGGSWELYSVGLGEVGVMSLEYDHNSRSWYAGTSHWQATGGVYRRSFVMTSVVEEGDVPSKYALHQNYPNPFNPTTTFSFSIPQSSIVNLRVFNLLGEEVATLVSERMDAGTHTVQWDAARQPSGVYFYRLGAGKFAETKKLLLIR